MKAAAFFLACLAWVMPASAMCPDGCPPETTEDAATAWTGDAEAPTRVILATPSHNYGGPIWGAVEIDIASGWFIYADSVKSAAGPQLEWAGSANLAPVALRWPPPETILLDGNPVAVFRGHVVLPISIAPIEAERDIRLALTFGYAVCGDVCRPASAKHRIRISAAPVQPSDAADRYARLIAAALVKANGG